MTADDDQELPEVGCDHCRREANESLLWDPDYVGTSVGGLALRGAHVCPACGSAYLSRRSTPAAHASAPAHASDADCDVGPDGCCRGCGVSHAGECGECGGRGYHRPGCGDTAAAPHARGWRISRGGRSVDAGGMRVRAEAGPGAPELMARIARVPVMEAALRAVAAALADQAIDDQTRIERIADALAAAGAAP